MPCGSNLYFTSILEIKKFRTGRNLEITYSYLLTLQLRKPRLEEIKMSSQRHTT